MIYSLADNSLDVISVFYILFYILFFIAADTKIFWRSSHIHVLYHLHYSPPHPLYNFI